MATKTVKLISELCYNQNQSWNFDRYIEVNGVKLRIQIIRNAYDNQSRAQVEKWSGDKWEHVYYEPITCCACIRISYVDKNITVKDFEIDYTRLLNIALKII